MIAPRRSGRPPCRDLLTPAEWRVVEGIRHGLSNPRIAARQGVSVNAVKYHVANALQKLGLDSRAELRRWNGIGQHSNLWRKDLVMEQQPGLGPIGQIARSVKNLSEARRWYQETLGLQHLYSFGNLAFFDCGGVRLFLSEGDGPASESILYFRVGDIRSSCAALELRGVNFTHAPHMIHRHEDGTEEWMAFFNDNEGRPLALMAQVPAPE
jgi:DNA-binding CsgD family transcriptional regulator/extradiol dioxygenase family protein